MPGDDEINLDQLKVLKEIFDVRVQQHAQQHKLSHGRVLPRMLLNIIAAPRGGLVYGSCWTGVNYFMPCIGLSMRGVTPMCRLMHACMQAADEDGSGELDIDEFCEKLGPHLGGNLTVPEIRQLFLKIDADAGGTVDWYERPNNERHMLGATVESPNDVALCCFQGGVHQLYVPGEGSGGRRREC